MRKSMGSLFVITIICMVICITSCPQETASLTVDFDTTQGSVSYLPQEASYTMGERVTIEATALEGYHFDHWEEALTGTENPTTVVVNGDVSVTAVFSPDTHLVTVTPQENGRIDLNGTQADDSYSFAYDSQFILEAVPDTGHYFSSWSGDLSSSQNPLTVTVDGDMTIGATFTELMYQVTVNSSDNGTLEKDGEVFSSGSLPYGTEFTLEAVPDTGYDFFSWSGDLSGSQNPLAVTVNKDMTIGATFAPLSYTVTVTPSNNGEVHKDGTAFTSGSFDVDATITLTAVPDDGYTIDSWGYGDFGTQDEIDLRVSNNITLVPTFKEYDHLLWKSPFANWTYLYSEPSVGPDDKIHLVEEYYSGSPASTYYRLRILSKDGDNLEIPFLGDNPLKTAPPLITPYYANNSFARINIVRDNNIIESYANRLSTTSQPSNGIEYNLSSLSDPHQIRTQLSYFDNGTSGDGDIYFRASNGTLYAVKNDFPTVNWDDEPPHFAEIRWENSSFETQEGSPITIDPERNTLYFVIGSTLYAINTTDGTEKWQYLHQATTDELSNGEPVIDSLGNIYIFTEDSRLLKIDSSGSIVTSGVGVAHWSEYGYKDYSFAIGDRSSIVIDSDNTLYLPGISGMRAIDSTDCSELWEVTLDGGGSGNIFILLGSDNMVYVIKGDKLFALDRDNGSIKWSYEFPPSNHINPPAITSEGTLIVSLVHTSELDYYGVIYAFETESFSGLDSTAPWPMYRANPQRTGERQ